MPPRANRPLQVGAQVETGKAAPSLSAGAIANWLEAVAADRSDGPRGFDMPGSPVACALHLHWDIGAERAKGRCRARASPTRQQVLQLLPCQTV